MLESRIVALGASPDWMLGRDLTQIEEVRGASKRHIKRRDDTWTPQAVASNDSRNLDNDTMTEESPLDRQLMIQARNWCDNSSHPLSSTRQRSTHLPDDR
jgi:hypothetical protein